MKEKRKINNIYIFYRISDNGFKNKIKPDYITKYSCLKNALSVFKGKNVFFNVYVDGVIDETDKKIHLLCDSRQNTKIIYLDIKSNGFSFRKIYEDACLLTDNDLVYFLEDDYLHKEESLKMLIDAAECNYTDYISLYDHPDKYDNNPTSVNQFCKELGEKCNLFKTNTHHWKTTNSTTMTFAAFVDVLKRDKNVFWKHTSTGFPYDFKIFLELNAQNKLLSTPIPSLSTHGETDFLAPFTDWEKISKQNSCCVVIITHKEKLNDDEEISFLRALKIFGGKRAIKLVIPNSIETYYYDSLNSNNIFEYVKVNDEWLSSYKAYNKTLCNVNFYKLFENYDYILIYQTDCWVFDDRLDEFMEMGYDWYGAAWPHRKDEIGNGGLSLRKVNKLIEITKKSSNDTGENEDLWFCTKHHNEMNICDLETACNFSIEVLTIKYKNLLKSHPMGLHGKIMKKYWGHQELLKQ